MKNNYMVSFAFVVFIISTASGLTPVIDDCRNNLFSSKYDSTPPIHSHLYSISPSNKWVLESITYASNGLSGDSVQLFLFQYCFPTEHRYMTTFYPAYLKKVAVQLMSDAATNCVNVGSSWGVKEDTVYVKVSNSTINTVSLKEEIFKIGITSITGGGTQSSQQTFTPKLLKSSNYPNPFVTGTTLEYSIPNDGYAAINIYNAKGELIKVLGQEKQQMGTHTIKWDGKDNLGNQISGGVYYYQIISGDFISTKTLIKIK